jgi:amino acid permease
MPIQPLSAYVEHALGLHHLTNAPRRRRAIEVLVRVFLVFSMIFIASVLPYFGPVLSFVSALTTIPSMSSYHRLHSPTLRHYTIMSLSVLVVISIVVFICPPLFYYWLYRPQGTMTTGFLIYLV